MLRNRIKRCCYSCGDPGNKWPGQVEICAEIAAAAEKWDISTAEEEPTYLLHACSCRWESDLDRNVGATWPVYKKVLTIGEAISTLQVWRSNGVTEQIATYEAETIKFLNQETITMVRTGSTWTDETPLVHCLHADNHVYAHCSKLRPASVSYISPLGSTGTFGPTFRPKSKIISNQQPYNPQTLLALYGGYHVNPYSEGAGSFFAAGYPFLHSGLHVDRSAETAPLTPPEGWVSASSSGRWFSSDPICDIVELGSLSFPYLLFSGLRTVGLAVVFGSAISAADQFGTATLTSDGGFANTIGAGSSPCPNCSDVLQARILWQWSAAYSQWTPSNVDLTFEHTSCTGCGIPQIPGRVGAFDGEQLYLACNP